MRPTQMLSGGGGGAPVGKHGLYLGGWGNFGGMKQKGIISYGIAPNRQYPLAGAAHDAIFNTWRRFSAQVLYWAPPDGCWLLHLELGYRPAGRAEFGGEEE
ncbi:ubiquinol--cytochrome-c reductase subunit 8 [Collariella sp. IMI 366227]|nr:ubiquinol--cytochrome-c reductase subunit 8 [Collariella sp. IMI 366227]